MGPTEAADAVSPVAVVSAGETAAPPLSLTAGAVGAFWEAGRGFSPMKNRDACAVSSSLGWWWVVSRRRRGMVRGREDWRLWLLLAAAAAIAAAVVCGWVVSP